MSQAVSVPVGSTVVDSLPFSHGGTPAQAAALREAGAKCVVGYLGLISASTIGNVLAAGMGFMPVTFAGGYDDGPKDELEYLKRLGVAKGTTVWLDMEGPKAFKSDPTMLIASINAWASAVVMEGYIAGLYVGAPQPLTSDELWGLAKVTRYWKGQGSTRDRHNALAEPTGCGWCMTQMYPSFNIGTPPSFVDANMVGRDYKGRLPTMMVSG